MPRYVVERTFPERLQIPLTEDGVEVLRRLVEHNTEQEVTWIHSYVSHDQRKSFCIYEAPNPEAIRRAAEQNGLPVDRITPVRVLDPFFYH